MDEKQVKSLQRKVNKLEAENDKLKGKKLEESGVSDEGFEGQYKHLASGEIFALKVVPEETVRFKRTHLARSVDKFGDYTESDFHAQFRKL